jgi:ABC-2 type transport system ATP-binding protein
MSSVESSVIRVENVSKKYRDFKALDDVQFEIKRGEIFGYIGPNGAGKTTTIKIIVGLMKNFGGDVFISGRSVRDDGAGISKLLGYLPQQAAFQEWRTVDHALQTFGRLSGLGGQELEGRIKEVLDMVGILEFRHKKINQLSGGTVQKVGMAQAILHRPEILILDEPMAGLDPASRYMFKRIFREVCRKDGTTIFFSSHILSDLEDVGDRIGILNGGKMMHTGTIEDLRSRMMTAKEIDLVLSKKPSRLPPIESIPGVAVVSDLSDDHYSVHLKDGADSDEVTDALVKLMVDSGCRVRSVSPVTPTLEQLYIRFLGGSDA